MFTTGSYSSHKRNDVVIVPYKLNAEIAVLSEYGSIGKLYYRLAL